MFRVLSASALESVELAGEDSRSSPVASLTLFLIGLHLELSASFVPHCVCE